MTDRKLPHLMEFNGRYAVEISDGVFLSWSQNGEVWSVRIETAPGAGGIELQSVSTEPMVH